jgi:type I site-specific restriction endonuclease
MQPLNLPTYSFKIKSEDNRKYIFDEVRRKYLLLTPEEWVRQNFVKYLVSEKKYPQQLISIEMEFKIRKLVKRCDIVVFNKSGNPGLIVECKSPSVTIGQDVFDQVSLYNRYLNVDFLVVTNGLKHYCCRYDRKEEKFFFTEDIPGYLDL